jgi:hypothetical protein
MNLRHLSRQNNLSITQLWSDFIERCADSMRCFEE